MIIGSGMTNPLIQYESLSKFAFTNRHHKISEKDYMNEIKKYEDCEIRIKNCYKENAGADTYANLACVEASKQCNKLVFSVGNTEYNPYDIRKNKLRDYFTEVVLNIDDYFASTSVSNILQAKSKYLSDSDEVF